MSIAPKQVGLVATIANLAASGALTVAGAVEQYRILHLAQTTAAIVATLPAPVDATVLFALSAVNTGTASIVVEGLTIAAGGAGSFAWTGSAWAVATPPTLPVEEVLAVTALNTVANTTGTPNTASLVSWYVNGNRVREGAGLSIAGQVVTVAPATLGFDLSPTDIVSIVYYA